MDTEWRAVVGFESIYEVSDAGGVRRVAPSTGRPERVGTGGARVGRVLTANTELDYPRVQLWKEGRYFNRLVHRLVAEAFLGPIPDGMEVNHIDGNKLNPSVANLEYVTPSENSSHAYRTGLSRSRPGPNGRYKLDEVTTVRVLAAHAEGRSCKSLGREHGVSDTTIRNMLKRNTVAA
jgi:hypothetical protein